MIEVREWIGDNSRCYVQQGEAWAPISKNVPLTMPETVERLARAGDYLVEQDPDAMGAVIGHIVDGKYVPGDSGVAELQRRIEQLQAEIDELRKQTPEPKVRVFSKVGRKAPTVLLQGDGTYAPFVQPFDQHSTFSLQTLYRLARDSVFSSKEIEADDGLLGDEVGYITAEGEYHAL